MIRVYKHMREIRKFLEMLHLDSINLTIQASRFGWTDELQNSINVVALFSGSNLSRESM